MKLAIAELARTAEIAKNNATIHQTAGDIDQANLCLKIAEECRVAAWLLVIMSEHSPSTFPHHVPQ